MKNLNKDIIKELDKKNLRVVKIEMDNDGVYLGNLYKNPKSKREALSMAIKKWRMVVLLKSKCLNVYEGGMESCGLCQRYFDRVKTNCGKCPVKMKTGKDFCVGSPYRKFRDTDTLEAAKAQLKFLRSLK